MTVPKIFLAKLRLFESRPDLAAKGTYTITSGVDREVVDLFFARLMGDEAEVVTTDNAEQLRALCDELGFAGFDGEIRAVLGGDVMTKNIRMEIWERLDGHDVRLEDQDVRLEEFWEALGSIDERVNEIASQLDVVIPSIEARLNEVVRAVREEFPERFRAVEEVRLNDVAQARREAGALREDVERLRIQVGQKASASDLAALSEEVARLKEAEANPTQSESATSKVLATPRQRQAQVAGQMTAQVSPLNGIIAHFTRECGGNVHKLGVVTVTASSCYGDWWKPENAVDFGSGSNFYSNDSPNSWICYDFKGRRVAPTSYSIRSFGYGTGACHPKSWVLEVSNDGSEGSWAVVDSRENNKDLNDVLATRNFAISAPSREAIRFARLRLTGKNHKGSDFLCISALELFGAFTDIPRPVAAPGEFPFYDLKPLDGIIAHLTRACGGNVHEKGVVTVTATGCYSSDYEPGNAVDLGSDSDFASKNSPQSWIRYDFKGRREVPTSYSIRSGQHAYPKSWVLEVSNDESDVCSDPRRRNLDQFLRITGTGHAFHVDGKKWVVVDRRTDNFDLNDRNVTRNFVLNTPPSGAFRFVRLRLTGTNHYGDDSLRIGALELFGALSSQ